MIDSEDPKDYRRISFTNFLKLVSKLPKNMYIRMHVESSEDDHDNDQTDFLCVLIFKTPPMGGWTSRGEFYNHQVGSPSYNDPCDKYSLNEDSVICAVNVYPDSENVLAGLATLMIKNRIG